MPCLSCQQSTISTRNLMLVCPLAFSRLHVWNNSFYFVHWIQSFQSFALLAAHISPGASPTGEFEKHAGCWMGWPYDKYLWRDNALPAKKQYAAVAKTISQFERERESYARRGVRCPPA